MKRIIALMLALLMFVGLTACGKSAAAQAADDLIAAIGTVTLDSGDKIAAAEAALGALTDKEIEQVENRTVLAVARTEYDALVKAAEEAEAARVAALQAAAAEVDAAISAIGTVTLDSQAAIDAAQAAYNALDAEAQSYVQNLADLEAAAAAISDLRVANVEGMIAAIGTVTLNSGDAIDAAQAAYDALSSADAAKVSNAAALTDAAAALKDLQKAEARKLLNQMYEEEDFVRGLSFYYPTAIPRGDDYWYADQRCFVLPYLGVQGDDVWLRLILNYTAYDWIFFEKVIIAADDQRFTESFSYWDVVRDNGGRKIWEYMDIDVGSYEIEMLWAIANSEKTVVRFEGDDYYDDFTVSASDKAAIRQMLTAYEALGGK